jgi:DNA adenine methylase
MGLRSLTTLKTADLVAGPFLKWPGGKRWLARKVLPYLQGSVDRYVEPFVGGAAMLFSVKPGSGIVADVNGDLINCYKAVARHHTAVLAELAGLKEDKTTYLWARNDWEPVLEKEKAARFIYLLRHSWNGLYRVNRKGRFNVPYCSRGFKNGLSSAKLAASAAVLRRVDIREQDFEVTFDQVSKGDLIFADPPYFSNDTETFRRYHASVFDEPRQVRLVECLKNAERRGARWILTNGCAKQIRKHLPGYACFAVHRPSTIAASAASRRAIVEYVVLSDSKSFGPLREFLVGEEARDE